MRNESPSWGNDEKELFRGIWGQLVVETITNCHTKNKLSMQCNNRLINCISRSKRDIQWWFSAGSKGEDATCIICFLAWYSRETRLTVQFGESIHSPEWLHLQLRHCYVQDGVQLKAANPAQRQRSLLQALCLAFARVDTPNSFQDDIRFRKNVEALWMIQNAMQRQRVKTWNTNLYFNHVLQETAWDHASYRQIHR
jgi:hypothetical protein